MRRGTQMGQSGVADDERGHEARPLRGTIKHGQSEGQSGALEESDLVLAEVDILLAIAQRGDWHARRALEVAQREELVGDRAAPLRGGRPREDQEGDRPREDQEGDRPRIGEQMRDQGTMRRDEEGMPCLQVQWPRLERVSEAIRSNPKQSEAIRSNPKQSPADAMATASASDRGRRP